MGVEGAPLEIIFGHNTEIRKVLMQFGAYVSSVTLDTDDAREIARKLNHYADMADGKKVT